MADPAPNMELNTGTQGTPTWTSIMSANQEWRYASTRQTNIASASWPQETRPTSGVSQLGFLHAYTADATGDQVVGTFALSNYNMARWNAQGGTFASAPILTAYASTAHAAITRGDNSLLGGNTTDTGATARSYLKATAYGFGFQTAAQTPAAAPTGAFPTATDGTTGSVATSTGAWSNGGAAWQGLQGDNDFITSGGASWDGTSGKIWQFMLGLFMGANETPGLYQPTCSLRYTWT